MLTAWWRQAAPSKDHLLKEHKMITLYGFGPGFALPESSPYVTKTEVQLKLAGLAYRKALAAPTDSPKGQLPFIGDDGDVIADSTFIRAHIERKHGVDLDEGLSARERAEAWAIERMLENHCAAAVGYSRWLIPENFAKGPAHFVDSAPEAARAALREDMLARVTASFTAQGMARHAPDEIVDLGARSLAALSLFLGDKPCLMGSQPCGVDAAAFGLLAGLLTPFFDSPLRRRAETFTNLTTYVDRMMARFYPEHPWIGVGLATGKAAALA
jgi:glutathione S-transferase